VIVCGECCIDILVSLDGMRLKMDKEGYKRAESKNRG
jgi:hypothetical protein